MQRLGLDPLRISRLARVLILSAIFIFSADSFTANAQSPDAVADLAARINRERIARGLVPYALNAQLTAAAQAHVNDIASTGRFSHTGSDGSTVFDRVARTGYAAYSWGRRLGENWAWYRNAAAAMEMWMQSAPHRANILHTVYREFGIGIAPAPQGGFVYVVDFGAQPNVLPVFIQNGAADTTSTDVTIMLSNEEAAPNGDGPKTIGRASEVQISGVANFAGAQWQPFAPRFAWTFAPGDETKTIYVRYRDARGRTVTSSDSISLNAPMAPPPPPSPKPTPLTTERPKPTALPTPRARLPAPTTTRVVQAPSGARAEATGAAVDISPMDTSSERNEMAVQPTGKPDLVVPTPTESPTPPESPTPAESPLPPELPTPVVMSLESSPQDNVVPIALGVFGAVLLLYVLVAVQYLANRSNKFFN